MFEMSGRRDDDDNDDDDVACLTIDSKLSSLSGYMYSQTVIHMKASLSKNSRPRRGIAIRLGLKDRYHSLLGSRRSILFLVHV
jgi:hypothetical protein